MDVATATATALVRLCVAGRFPPVLYGHIVGGEPRSGEGEHTVLYEIACTLYYVVKEGERENRQQAT